MRFVHFIYFQCEYDNTDKLYNTVAHFFIRLIKSLVGIHEKYDLKGFLSDRCVAFFAAIVVIGFIPHIRRDKNYCEIGSSP